MDDLIARIKEAIDEDERIARRAADAHEGSPDWRFIRGNEDVEPAVIIGKRSLYSDYHGDEGLMPSEVEHIASQDPDAVLTRAKWEHGLLATLAEFVNSDHPSVRVLARSAVTMLARARGIEPGNRWGTTEFER